MKQSQFAFANIPALLVTMFVLAGCGSEQAEKSPSAAPPATSDAPIAADVPQNPLREACHGELHLHTAWSLDAYGFGSTLVDPDEAYRFAQGETIDRPGGGTAKITQPLDFAAVVEHAEWVGETRILTSTDHPRYNDPFALAVRAADEDSFDTIIGAEM